MGNTRETLRRKAWAILIAACLAATMVPAAALADGEYGTDAGGAERSEGPQGSTVSTDVGVAVKGQLSVETTPSRIVFRSADDLTDADRFLHTTAQGGVKRQGAQDGLPYTYTWSRLMYDAATKQYVEEPAGGLYKMNRVVIANATDRGMELLYDLKSDTYKVDTLYRYTVTVTDGAGRSASNDIDVFCGNEYIYGTITNGSGAKREGAEAAAAAADDEPTVVDVTAMRRWDSELVVADLGPEGRSELLPYVQGDIMDAAANVALVSETATESKPVFIVPPKVKLAIRLHDQDVDAGWPVRVLAIQGGRVVTVSEPDAVVEVDAGGWKVARVGIPDVDDSGVEALGVFAVCYPPKGGDAERVKVTSRAGIPVGIDGFGEAASAGGRVAPADTATPYALGTSVRYTFTPDAGYAFDFATLGTDADGAKNPRVTTDTPNAALGANFVDLTVAKPASGDALYLTAYFRHVGAPPTDPDDPDAPIDPMKAYSVWAGAGPGGAISPAGAFLVRTGEDASFTVVPDAGYAPDKVTVNGHEVALAKQPGGTYTFTVVGVQGDMVVWATFKESPGASVTEEPLRVAVTSVGAGQAHPAGTTRIAPGSSLTLTLVPDAGCRLLSLTRDGRDVTADVAANLTYALSDVRADTAIVATFSDAAGATDPVAPGRALITTKVECAGAVNAAGQAVGGYIVPYRATADTGDVERFTVKPVAGSYAASATARWTDADGDAREQALDLHALPLPEGAAAPASAVMKPYLYVDVEAASELVELTVVFDGCERDPANPGGDEYVYPDTPMPPMQHKVDIEVVTVGGAAGGVATAARDGEMIGAAPSYVMMAHGGTLTLGAVPYGGYAAQIEVVEGDLSEAGSQASVPAVADPGHASGAPVARAYTVEGAGKVRITFTKTGGYTPPSPQPGSSLIQSVAVGAGTVSPGFATIAEGAPAASFTITPDEGYRLSSLALYDQTSGADVSAKLPAWTAAGGTIGLGYIDEHAYALVAVFGKVGQGADGPTDPGNTGDPDGPDAAHCTLTARVGTDLPQYTGKGEVSIEGAPEGSSQVVLRAGQSATVVFAPAANSILGYATLAEGAGAPREVSVLGSRLTLTATDADMVVTAYFRYGTFIEHVDLDVTLEQNLTPEECGWQLSGTPAEKVPYGDALVVSVDPVAGSDKAAGYRLSSLTVNGTECAGALTGGKGRAAGYVGGSYTYPSVTEDTRVVATFEAVPLDDPGNPDDPDGPDEPGKPGTPDDPGADGPGQVSYVTVSASSAGGGTIEPSGDVRVVKGRAVSFSLRPDAGFQPVSVSITDSAGTRTVRQATTQLTLTVSEDTEVVARFATQAYPGPDDGASRLVRHLRSLASTGDGQLIAALALAGIACAAAGALLIVGARRRKKGRDEA